MQISSILPLVLTFVCLTSLQAQLTLPPAGVKYAVSYKLEESTYYTVPESTPIELLSPLDVQKMKKTRTLKSVQRQVEENGDHSSIIYYLNPDEAYSVWPKPLGGIILDQTGSKTLNPDGTLIKFVPADSVYSASYNQMKGVLAEQPLNVLFDLPVPDSTNIAEMQANGAIVEQLSDGRMSIRQGAGKVTYDLQNQTITRSRIEGGVEVQRNMIQYSRQGDILTPDIEIQETQVIRPSGACMKSIVEKHYSDYQVASRISGRNNYNKSIASEITIIQPNPVTDKAMVKLGSNVQDGSNLLILDGYGKVLRQLAACQAESTVQIYLGDFQAGVYFLQVDTKNGPQTFKLVKN